MLALKGVGGERKRQMAKDHKIIGNKLGPLKLAQALGSVSEACKQGAWLQPGQLLAIQGAVRHWRGGGAGGDFAQEAESEEPGRSEGRRGGEVGSEFRYRSEVEVGLLVWRPRKRLRSTSDEEVDVQRGAGGVREVGLDPVPRTAWDLNLKC
jgi:hypothetical protein